MSRRSSALSPIAIAEDHDRPIGERLAILRAWREQIEKEERRLLMQLGCDTAKYLFAQGVDHHVPAAVAVGTPALLLVVEADGVPARETLSAQDQRPLCAHVP